MGAKSFERHRYFQCPVLQVEQLRISTELALARSCSSVRGANKLILIARVVGRALLPAAAAAALVVRSLTVTSASTIHQSRRPDHHFFADEVLQEVLAVAFADHERWDPDRVISVVVGWEDRVVAAHDDEDRFGSARFCHANLGEELAVATHHDHDLVGVVRLLGHTGASIFVISGHSCDLARNNLTQRPVRAEQRGSIIHAVALSGADLGRGVARRPCRHGSGVPGVAQRHLQKEVGAATANVLDAARDAVIEERLASLIEVVVVLFKHKSGNPCHVRGGHGRSTDGIRRSGGILPRRGDVGAWGEDVSALAVVGKPGTVVVLVGGCYRNGAIVAPVAASAGR
mmetsp:Transcript_16194/g.45906  ORF Transcript_16194/g.45906 Transcript_16194/m.45906 type:complete len:344 (+) Transcript_16194:71-1102(+)